MMGVDSTNIQSPFFGPEHPEYPAIPQICRVYAPDGPVYSAYVSQWIPDTVFLRDREAVYVFEPNGVPLSPGYYDCRLVGNYLGLPLLATTCCQLPSSSSSSSS
jgi:hypothetical protein